MNFDPRARAIYSSVPLRGGAKVTDFGVRTKAFLYKSNVRGEQA
jgi:hypothetical protein